MPTYSPTIIFNSTPAIAVSMGGNLTYAEFVASLGAYVYLINSIYMQAYTFEQFNQTIQYTAYDATGYLFSNAIPLVPNPYQYQPALKLESPTFGMVLNGRSYFNFNIDVGERVQMILCTDEISFSGMLDSVGKELDDDLGQLALFDNFNHCVE
jgi:hypothetical protein